MLTLTASQQENQMESAFTAIEAKAYFSNWKLNTKADDIPMWTDDLDRMLDIIYSHGPPHKIFSDDTNKVRDAVSQI